MAARTHLLARLPRIIDLVLLQAFSLLGGGTGLTHAGGAFLIGDTNAMIGVWFAHGMGAVFAMAGGLWYIGRSHAAKAADQDGSESECRI